jgi:hypothetical protein
MGAPIGLGEAGRVAGSNASVKGTLSGALVELVDRVDEISEPFLRRVALDYPIDDHGAGVRLNNDPGMSISMLQQRHTLNLVPRD